MAEELPSRPQVVEVVEDADRSGGRATREQCEEVAGRDVQRHRHPIRRLVQQRERHRDRKEADRDGDAATARDGPGIHPSGIGPVHDPVALHGPTHERGQPEGDQAGEGEHDDDREIAPIGVLDKGQIRTTSDRPR